VALAAIPDLDQDEDVSVSITGPTPIGPWRTHWWRRFSEGYRLDVEEKMQWTQPWRGGWDCSMPRSADTTDLRRLQRVLDCHNVTLPEWLLLAAMDDTCTAMRDILPQKVAESAEWKFGVTVSEDECRDGLEACLRYGWLRLAQNARDEVDAVLRAEPAVMPVARDVQGWDEDEVDFTPNGAALYRMISAEWLGPDWEDALSVWNVYYRELHLYSVTEKYLPGYSGAEQGEVVLESKLVPIGPWCSLWWQRFPSGYRLELKIGTP
jgi:hypothetical protein